MASHESRNGGSYPRASKTVQGFKVFRDASQGPSLQVDSPEETMHYLEDEFASIIPPHHPSPSPCQSFVCDSPTVPELDGTHDMPRNSRAKPRKGYNKSSAGLDSLPMASPETNVLAKNTLKINLSPRTTGTKRLHESIDDKSSSRNKRRLLQADEDDGQYPRKSPKLKDPSAHHKQDLKIQSEDNHEPLASMETHENSSSSSILPQTANSQEHMDDSAVNDKPSQATSETQVLETGDPENTEEIPDKSFATFNGGDVTTPRPSAMYNFNSAIRMFNPFKAVGNLFGRLSATHSPSRPRRETVNSEEIAKQVKDHLQHFEDKLFDRLVAFQAANKSNHSMMPNASSPPLPEMTQELTDYLATGLDLSPLHKFGHDTSSAMNSSPLLPTSQFKNIALHPTDLQQLDEQSKDVYRSSLAAVLLSPTEQRSKRMLSGTETGTNAANGAVNKLDASPETSVEPPRLRNKASQHLKKMASKMNLRSRKSKANDEVPVNNDDYRVMKKKNKDEILKDYLMLQREKQELERQLIMKSRLDKQEGSTNTDVPSTTLLDNQNQAETNLTKATPVLLEAAIPDLRVNQKRSNSPDSGDMEQTRTKRMTMSTSNVEGLGLSSPLASMNDSVSNRRQSQSEEQATNDPGEKDQLMDDAKSNHTSHIVKKVPPVPAVPSKYRSKVPKPTRAKETSKTKQIDSDWKGWDSEIF